MRCDSGPCEGVWDLCRLQIIWTVNHSVLIDSMMRDVRHTKLTHDRRPAQEPTSQVCGSSPRQ